MALEAKLVIEAVDRETRVVVFGNGRSASQNFIDVMTEYFSDE